jgi:hypothetical protein
VAVDDPAGRRRRVREVERVGRRGDPARIQQWRLTRDAWERIRRDDIELTGVEECLLVLCLGEGGVVDDRRAEDPVPGSRLHDQVRRRY